MTRIGLNLVSGRDVSLALLFGGGSKLLPAIMATMLYWTMVMVGLILLAGCLAFCIGVFFAWPVILMSGFAAYRWMQFGTRAAMDHPGTQTPMLAGMR